jgi:hypothetical protein
VFYVETMMIIILGVTSVKVVLLNCCQLQVDLGNYISGGIRFAATMLARTNVVEEKQSEISIRHGKEGVSYLASVNINNALCGPL